MSSWIERFRDEWEIKFPEHGFGEGVYYEKYNPETGRPVIVVDHHVHEKTFEVWVGVNHDKRNLQIVFITDSVEVLKALTSRGFPLDELARKFVENKQGVREVIFDVAKCNYDRSVEDMGVALRMVPVHIRNTPESTAYEVRLIKK